MSEQRFLSRFDETEGQPQTRCVYKPAASFHDNEEGIKGFGVALSLWIQL